MRISILATIFAFGMVIALPAQAQQSTGSSSQQQMQDDADKGIKTRNSGESGYVGEQERPGASSHVPGQPDTKSSQTTTGTGSSTRETGGKAGGVSVGEQEKKPVTAPAPVNPANPGAITHLMSAAPPLRKGFWRAEPAVQPRLTKATTNREMLTHVVK